MADYTQIVGYARKYTQIVGYNRKYTQMVRYGRLYTDSGICQKIYTDSNIWQIIDHIPYVQHLKIYYINKVREIPATGSVHAKPYA
jgi:hypothetical protein